MARPMRDWTPEQDAVIQQYPAKGISRLALELNTSQKIVRRRLVELGLQIRKPGRPGHALPARKESDFGSDSHYYGTDMEVAPKI